METLKNLKPTKEIWLQIKWILSHAKSVIPYLIFSVLVSTTFSIIGIYNIVVSKSLIDSAISGNKQDVIKWLIIMITISLLSMLSSPVTSFLSTHASTRLNQNIQRKIYKHIEYCDWLELNKHHSISLLTRITSDVSNISSTLLGTIPSLVALSVTLIGSFYTLINWAPSIALIAVFIGPFLVIIAKIFGSKLKKLYKDVQEISVKYNSFMQESMQNIMITKAFCMEEKNITRLEEIQEERYRLSMKNTRYSVFTSMSMSICSTTAYFSIFSWGILNIAKGTTTYGTFTAMLQLYSKVQSPFSSLAGMLPGLISTLAAAERLMDLETIPLEKSSKVNISNEFTKPNIEFKAVNFEYKVNNPILKNINLSIPFGETIAFVGPSGEGKTTMIRLILSLINPREGKVYLSEGDIVKNLNRDYRSLISYVPQGNTLFSGSIEDNLRYGKSDATIDEIVEALSNACALDFIKELEDGIKTKIGERGVGISEGQAQRIAIARSFLRQKPILILDEATASLDPKTELNVLTAIKSLPHKPTCIIITHRPSALDICNRIIKLEKGEIVEVNKNDIIEVASTLD